jgi:peptidyl-prolyl cis-trans isomerase SurA
MRNAYFLTLMTVATWATPAASTALAGTPKPSDDPKPAATAAEDRAQQPHAAPVTQDLNGLAAVVEGEVITLDELYREMMPMARQVRLQSGSPEEYEQRMHALEREVLQTLVDRILIVKEFDKQGFQIPEALFENEYENHIKQNFNGDRVRLLRFLEAQGKTMQQFKKAFKDNMIVAAMRAKRQRSAAEISPAKIEQYYEAHQEDFRHEAQLHLRQALFSGPGAQAQARAFVQELKKGTDFDQVAQSLSAESSDLGWVSRSDLIEPLAEAAFGLKEGAHSEVIAHKDHYFVLWAQEAKPAGVRPLDEVREEIEIILANQLGRESMERWLERLRQKAYIHLYL